MRLLDTQTLGVVEFSADEIPRYAILSHTWGPEEVSYQDMLALENRGIAARLTSSKSVKDKIGFSKVKSAAQLAAGHNFRYVWIDTCCIDKSSSAELSEAINSMYRWYQEAAICYAFLSDVPPESRELPSAPNSAFRRSRWFTRGWTLQELIAPRHMLFYASDWTSLGTRSRTALEPDGPGVGAELLSSITGIDSRVLKGDLLPEELSVAARMSWASLRKTTRKEDMAYCLLGIFGVNLPLLYGEGDRAFLRLQEAIFRETDDQSLFAWVLPPMVPLDPGYGALFGLLASSPLSFRDAGNIQSLPPLAEGDTMPPTISSKGLHLQLHLRPARGAGEADAGSHDYHAILDCSVWAGGAERYPAILLRQLRGSHFARIQADKIIMMEPPALGVAWRWRRLPVSVCAPKASLGSS